MSDANVVGTFASPGNPDATIVWEAPGFSVGGERIPLERIAAWSDRGFVTWTSPETAKWFGRMRAAQPISQTPVDAPPVSTSRRVTGAVARGCLGSVVAMFGLIALFAAFFGDPFLGGSPPPSVEPFPLLFGAVLLTLGVRLSRPGKSG